MKYFVEQIQFAKEYPIEDEKMGYFKKKRKIFLRASSNVTQIILSKNHLSGLKEKMHKYTIKEIKRIY